MKQKKASEIVDFYLQTETILKSKKAGDTLSDHEIKTLQNFICMIDDILYGNHGANWSDIFTAWQRSPFHSKTIDGLEGFLEVQYISPIKK